MRGAVCGNVCEYKYRLAGISYGSVFETVFKKGDAFIAVILVARSGKTYVNKRIAFDAEISLVRCAGSLIVLHCIFAGVPFVVTHHKHTLYFRGDYVLVVHHVEHFGIL